MDKLIWMPTRELLAKITFWKDTIQHYTNELRNFIDDDEAYQEYVENATWSVVLPINADTLDEMLNSFVKEMTSCVISSERLYIWKDRILYSMRLIRQQVIILSHLLKEINPEVEVVYRNFDNIFTVAEDLFDTYIDDFIDTVLDSEELLDDDGDLLIDDTDQGAYFLPESEKDFREYTESYMYCLGTGSVDNVIETLSGVSSALGAKELAVVSIRSDKTDILEEYGVPHFMVLKVDKIHATIDSFLEDNSCFKNHPFHVASDTLKKIMEIVK